MLRTSHSATLMEDAGQRLKRVRDRLGLRYRDVEQASLSIAQRHGNDEFAIALSRLADIENKGTIPTLYRLYSLCAIYRLDLAEVLGWYGIDLSKLPGDAAHVEVAKTHVIQFTSQVFGTVQVPLSLDPGIDLKKTTHLSRMIQKWGSLPLMLLNGVDLDTNRYAFVGSDDFWMHPLIRPGSLLWIDDQQKRPASGPWATEHERPVYFLEHRDGFLCSWCHLSGNQLIAVGHPAMGNPPLVLDYPRDVDVIGQVAGVAMRLDPARKRPARSASTQEAFQGR